MSASVKITGSRLLRWGMCKDGVAKFRERYPRGLTLRFSQVLNPDTLPEGLEGWSSLISVLSPERFKLYSEHSRALRRRYVRDRKRALLAGLIAMEEMGELPK